jgi:hypothetical protein
VTSGSPKTRPIMRNLVGGSIAMVLTWVSVICSAWERPSNPRAFDRAPVRSCGRPRSEADLARPEDDGRVPRGKSGAEARASAPGRMALPGSIARR